MPGRLKQSGGQGEILVIRLLNPIRLWNLIFAIKSVAATVPSAYAAHADEAHVIMAIGSGIAGCETTADGCFIPTTVTIAAGGHVEWENT